MIIETDLVLIYVDSKPGFYARIEEISPDVKPGWWLVKLLVLTFPLQIFTWILDENQLEETAFTMGGTPLRLEKLISPLQPAQPQAEEQIQPVKNKVYADTGQKVVSLAERRKK